MLCIELKNDSNSQLLSAVRRPGKEQCCCHSQQGQGPPCTHRGTALLPGPSAATPHIHQWGWLIKTTSCLPAHFDTLLSPAAKKSNMGSLFLQHTQVKSSLTASCGDQGTPLLLPGQPRWCPMHQCPNIITSHSHSPKQTGIKGADCGYM